MEGELAETLNALPKFVVSSTLETTTWNATVLGAGWVEGVGRIRRELDRDIIVYGSRRLSAALLERGLVDEIRQTVYPLMLGSGDRLFGDTGLKQSLRLLAARTLNHGVVHLVHQPSPRAA
jgi:dihydrofolate reductase